MHAIIDGFEGKKIKLSRIDLSVSHVPIVEVHDEQGKRRLCVRGGFDPLADEDHVAITGSQATRPRRGVLA